MPRRRHFDQNALDQVVRRHAGVMTLADLSRVGVPSSTVAYRVRPGGPWQRVLPGVVAAVNGTLTPHQRLLAALAYAGNEALVTGVAALGLHGVAQLPADEAVHLLVPHRRHRVSHAFVVVERTTRLPARRWRQGVPCAPVPRAVIDACRRMGDVDAVRSLIAEAVQRRHCQLEDVVAELRRAQIRGTRRARLVVAEVTAGVRSVAEARARRLLLRHGLPPPLWNHDVYDAEGHWVGRPDAIWPDLGVILEIDSLAWHLLPRAYRHTQERQRRLTRVGLMVIPVAPTDLDHDADKVLAQIRDTLTVARTRVPPAVIVRPARSSLTA